MPSVAINPPKTPVHKGSHTIASATIPNICKMPGPPAPFVPAPLPNIAKSELSPQGYSTTVEIEGNAVAIRGATFESIGDIASKGTGGGLISANCQGPAKFITPGSMTVKIEGKNVQLLSDSMLNNLGPGGSPPNTGATMNGAVHAPLPPATFASGIDCEKNKAEKGWDDCDVAQLCAKVAETNKLNKKGKLDRQTGNSNKDPAYDGTKGNFYDVFAAAATASAGSSSSFGEQWLQDKFYHPCAKERWEENGRNARPNDKKLGRGAFQADHVHDCQLGCNLNDMSNFKMLSQSVNGSIGSSLSGFDPDLHPGGVTLPKCDCPS
jgi:uncharacterized Zn-binding protein involved in type VI secretion